MSSNTEKSSSERSNLSGTQSHIEKRCISLLSVVALTTAMTTLVGCGGGGGDATTTPAPAPTPQPAPAPSPAANSDLVTSVTPATYSSGSVELGGWTALLNARGTCGFGLLQQDSRLDAANAAHADYHAQNTQRQGSIVFDHYETAGLPGFTGVNPLDRARAKGWPLTMGVGEIIDAFYAVYPSGQASPFASSEALGREAMMQLIGTVYHLRGAMSAGRFGGVGSASLIQPGPSTTTAYFFFGALLSSDPNPQRLGIRQVATYPCAGVQDVDPTFAPATESPNPFPTVTNPAVLYGTPIYVKVDPGQVLTLSTWSVQPSLGGAAAAVTVMTKTNDPAKEIGANEAFIVPTSALMSNTRYKVQIAGSIDSAAFTRSFEFTTGP